MPKDYPLAKCYRFDPNFEEGEETDEANVHLLAALGTFKEPFVPVDIHQRYDGYSWAKLPLIQKVEVSIGKELHQQWLWAGTLTGVDSLTITAHASDGRVLTSPVCMAVAPEPPETAPDWAADCVLVTPEAEERLAPSEIWYHFGGWSDEGDTYETQEAQFEEELDRFWAQLVGPNEHLRRSILSSLAGIKPEWKSVTITSDGTVTVQYTDGAEKTLEPPPPASSASAAE